MTSTQHSARTAPPRTRRLDRPTAMRLAATEYDRFLAAVAAVPDDRWHAPTDNVGWDVHAMVGHVLGMTKMAASIRETRRQPKLAAAGSGPFIDELTALQVREHSGLTREQLQAELARVIPKAARARRRAPALVRRRRMPVPQRVNGRDEEWTIGFLLDTILTRDPWMHRVDLVRATGVAHEVTADHDGVLVDDVVREWAERHGQPYALRLTGPAGGTWSSPGVTGESPAPIEMDAIEFCRAVSGRASNAALFGTDVPF